jgi:hypothetical protein
MRVYLTLQGVSVPQQMNYSAPAFFYGSMPASAPAAYVPVVRPSYVSYAAASGASLQPDAAPFVSPQVIKAVFL